LSSLTLLRRLRSAASLRGRHLLLFDLLATVSAFLLSLALRFDAPSSQFENYVAAYFWIVPLLFAVRIGTYLVLGLYQRAWQFASVDELVALVIGGLASSAICYSFVWALAELRLLSSLPPFPRSIPVIDTLLLIAFTGAGRFSLRIVGARRLGSKERNHLERAVVVGGGSAAIAVLRELRSSDELPFHAVGVLADDLPLHQRLMGVAVIGRANELEEIVAREAVSVVLLALPSARGKALRELVRAAERAGARCLTVPSMAEVAAGRVTLNALREIDVEDLLRRAPAKIDMSSVVGAFKNSTVLITGAGGSIGAELARQLALAGPRHLILAGHGENSIHDMLQTLPPAKDERTVSPVIVDVRDADRIERLIAEFKPGVVFHAAAHKHVGFMESFPQEAIETNIVGTLNVVMSSSRHGVGRFVLISSDKAVNPRSVMGATKRVAELIVSAVAASAQVRYVSVRFGNVLSSRGSVVPLFRQQLARGGPITVTDPEVSRFFMTIPEAVQLVLQASVMARPGDTFVLDMGDPVRIVDLARDLAELHGLEVGKDIEIEFVGLKPGEKLTEDLFFRHERPLPTDHEAILRVGDGWAAPADIFDKVAAMLAPTRQNDRAAIIAALCDLVPEYRPAEREARESARE
jgi:FlaA1/EpsC-like NDP-sugar epimerase